MILSLGHMLVNSHLKHLKIKVRSQKRCKKRIQRQGWNKECVKLALFTQRKNNASFRAIQPLLQTNSSPLSY